MLDDFGPADFYEGLAVLCESIDDEALVARLDYGMRIPEAARAMTSRWISEVPSKSV